MVGSLVVGVASGPERVGVARGPGRVGVACGQGLPPLHLLPSPFEPPRNATSPRRRTAAGVRSCFRAQEAGAAAE